MSTALPAILVGTFNNFEDVCSWPEDLHMVLTLSSCFPLVYLVILPSQMQQRVLCERNSSYNVILIFLKLCKCVVHCLKMYMWFGHYHQIICPYLIKLGNSFFGISYTLSI